MQKELDELMRAVRAMLENWETVINGEAIVDIDDLRSVERAFNNMQLHLDRDAAKRAKEQTIRKTHPEAGYDELRKLWDEGGKGWETMDYIAFIRVLLAKERVKA